MSFSQTNQISSSPSPYYHNLSRYRAATAAPLEQTAFAMSLALAFSQLPSYQNDFYLVFHIIIIIIIYHTQFPLPVHIFSTTGVFFAHYNLVRMTDYSEDDVNFQNTKVNTTKSPILPHTEPADKTTSTSTFTGGNNSQPYLNNTRNTNALINRSNHIRNNKRHLDDDLLYHFNIVSETDKTLEVDHVPPRIRVKTFTSSWMDGRSSVYSYSDQCNTRRQMKSTLLLSCMYIQKENYAHSVCSDHLTPFPSGLSVVFHEKWRRTGTFHQ